MRLASLLLLCCLAIGSSSMSLDEARALLQQADANPEYAKQDVQDAAAQQNGEAPAERDGSEPIPQQEDVNNGGQEIGEAPAETGGSEPGNNEKEDPALDTSELNANPEQLPPAQVIAKPPKAKQKERKKRKKGKKKGRKQDRKKERKKRKKKRKKDKKQISEQDDAGAETNPEEPVDDPQEEDPNAPPSPEEPQDQATDSSDPNGNPEQGETQAIDPNDPNYNLEKRGPQVNENNLPNQDQAGALEARQQELEKEIAEAKDSAAKEAMEAKLKELQTLKEQASLQEMADKESNGSLAQNNAAVEPVPEDFDPENEEIAFKGARGIKPPDVSYPRPSPFKPYYKPKPKPCPHTCCNMRETTVNLHYKYQSVFNNLFDSVEVLQPPTAWNSKAECSHTALLKVEFDKISPNHCPGHCQSYPGCGRRMLKVSMELHETQRSSGYRRMFNIGDSVSNNGWGGDYGHQKNDAELDGRDDSLLLYPSDLCERKEPFIFKNALAPNVNKLDLYLANGFVRVTNDQGCDEEVCLPECSFALNGQPDASSGGINEVIYIGINRQVHNTTSTDRLGSGVCRLKLRWMCPWPVDCPKRDCDVF